MMFSSLVFATGCVRFPPSNIRRYQGRNDAIPATEQSFSEDEQKALKLPGGRQPGIRSIAAERTGPDTAGEEGSQRGIVLSYPIYGYLDGTGYVDPCSLGGGGRPSI